MITEASPVEFDDGLPVQSDVVVIGGGIAGIATAYYLARQGIAVTVCEKGRVAGEQSSRNWGWVRQQGRDPAELPIMMEAIRLWRGLAQETGEADLSFVPSGCLYLAASEQQLAKYAAWYDIALAHQLPTKMLTGAEIRSRYPGVAGDFAGGMVTESDGRAEPFVAVPALARAARRAGAIVRENCAARALDVAGGQISGVFTEAGRIGCEKVVLAAGVWSTHFAHNHGLSVAQLAVRSTVARTTAVDVDLGPNISLPGLAARKRDDGGYSVSSGDLAEHFLSPASFRHLPKFLKLLRRSAKDVRIRFNAPNGFPGTWAMRRRWSGDDISPFEQMRVVNPAPSPEVVRRIKARLPGRLPALANAGIAQAWAGMIDVTPDAVPFLGEAHNRPGLFFATGLSGHGFGIGPAVGRLCADLVAGKSPGYDLNRFRSSRFEDGSEIVPGPY